MNCYHVNVILVASEWIREQGKLHHNFHIPVARARISTESPDAVVKMKMKSSPSSPICTPSILVIVELPAAATSAIKAFRVMFVCESLWTYRLSFELSKSRINHNQVESGNYSKKIC